MNTNTNTRKRTRPTFLRAVSFTFSVVRQSTVLRYPLPPLHHCSVSAMASLAVKQAGLLLALQAAALLALFTSMPCVRAPASYGGVLVQQQRLPAQPDVTAYRFQPPHSWTNGEPRCWMNAEPR